MSAPGRSYDAARAALYALVPRGVVLGLEPMRAALAARGSPHARLPAVHVAGTNGKGSVAAMVDAALRAEGRRVGLYTSPHLHRFAERIRIDGTPCDQALLGEVAWEVLDAMAAGALPPLTFFEATTLMAWEAFARAGVETVVLEVGLGGRLDATNVCVPVATAITRIARDHEALLGSSLAEIAREKAGILKPDVPCVLGPDLARGEAREAIAAVAGEVGAPLHQAPMARVVATDATGTALSIETARGPLAVTLPLGGEHQAGNAAVAVGLLEVLGVAPEAIAGGLASVSWPARMERVGGLLFDVAHNPDGVAALVAALDRLPEPPSRRALVFGASHDKDWRGMLDLLAPRVPVAHRFYCAASLRRAEDPFALAAHAGGEACASVGEALSRARTAVGGEGLVVVCGSIYAVAEARALALGLPCDPPVPM